MEDSKQSKILDKVRKLLAKANATDSQEEMETFLAAANKLQKRYNIESEQIDLDVTDFGHERLDVTRTKRESRLFEGRLLQIIAVNNNCKMIYHTYGKTVTGFSLIGSHEDRQIVTETFKVCVERFRTYAAPRYREYIKKEIEEYLLLTGIKLNAKTLRQRGEVVSARVYQISYLDGALKGLSERYKEEAKTIFETPEAKAKWGLIVVNKDSLVTEYMASSFRNLGTMNSSGPRKRSAAGYGEGVADGKSSNMNKELGA